MAHRLEPAPHGRPVRATRLPVSDRPLPGGRWRRYPARAELIWPIRDHLGLLADAERPTGEAPPASSRSRTRSVSCRRSSSTSGFRRSAGSVVLPLILVASIIGDRRSLSEPRATWSACRCACSWRVRVRSRSPCSVGFVICGRVRPKRRDRVGARVGGVHASADRDRHRRHPLPPLRDRPAGQPRPFLGGAERVAAGGVCGRHLAAPGPPRRPDPGPDRRRGGLHAPCRRSLPAAPAARPERRRPSLQPGSLRCRTDRERLRRAPARRDGPHRAAVATSPASSTPPCARPRSASGSAHRARPPRNDSRTPDRQHEARDDSPDPSDPPLARSRRARRRRRAGRPPRGADRRPSRPPTQRLPRSRSTSPRAIPCSPTSSPHPVRSTLPGSSSTRRRSPRSARPVWRWSSRSSPRASSSARSISALASRSRTTRPTIAGSSPRSPRRQRPRSASPSSSASRRTKPPSASAWSRRCALRP